MDRSGNKQLIIPCSNVTKESTDEKNYRRQAYDTETAAHVANFNNGMSSGELRWVYEDLYRTTKGSWFIHGAGGAMTSYAKPCGSNNWAGGEEIRVLSPMDAKEWLEEHGETDAIESYFEVEDA